MFFFRADRACTPDGTSKPPTTRPAVGKPARRTLRIEWLENRSCYR